MLAIRGPRSGFSLIEVLVVLAIILVLLTLLVPVLTRALRMAKRTAAGEEMRGPARIAKWDFLSTRLEETGRMDLGGNVVYTDGRVQYVPYPREFPMSRQVAELSHRFYMEVVN